MVVNSHPIPHNLFTVVIPNNLVQHKQHAAGDIVIIQQEIVNPVLEMPWKEMVPEGKFSIEQAVSNRTVMYSLINKDQMRKWITIPVTVDLSFRQWTGEVKHDSLSHFKQELIFSRRL